MAAYLADVLNLFFRWFHVIAGVAWIGASFYFVWLDLSLREPPEWKKKKGIKGDLWSIHGGGFYEVAKYQLGPEEMPKTLHWFKWEAYTTWLTGFALLSVIYYWGAEQYLIDSQKISLSQIQAIGLSLACLLGGMVVYEALVRSPLRYQPKVFGAVLFVLLAFSAWGFGELFSDRAAYLHVGALIGTIMAGNVMLGIMPAQRELVRAVTAGEQPNPLHAEFAKARSTHNNYLTLPLIFIMLSNHYPMTYGHEHAWLVLAVIGGLMAFVRHYFNLKHQDNHQPWILVAGFIGMIAVVFWLTPKPVAVDASAPVIPDEQGMMLVATHCQSCHTAEPTQAGFVAPPAGLVMETKAQVAAQKARMIPALQTNYMPLGNMTGMSEGERETLIQWLGQMP
tara:strand:+ start:3254 stop:4435 length:1182 start_codon:yes stop_codon:yes gene_type:complete